MKSRSTNSESEDTLSKCLELETPAQNTVKTRLYTTMNEIRTIITSMTERGLQNTIEPTSNNNTDKEKIGGKGGSEERFDKRSKGTD